MHKIKKMNNNEMDLLQSSMWALDAWNKTVGANYCPLISYTISYHGITLIVLPLRGITHRAVPRPNTMWKMTYTSQIIGQSSHFL